MVLGKLLGRGVLYIWIKIREGPTAVAVGVGWDDLDIFFLSSITSYFFSSF